MLKTLTRVGVIVTSTCGAIALFGMAKAIWIAKNVPQDQWSDHDAEIIKSLRKIRATFVKD